MNSASMDIQPDAVAVGKVVDTDQFVRLRSSTDGIRKKQLGDAAPRNIRNIYA